MLGAVAKHLKDVSVLRRLLFAARYLPLEIPNFWGIVVEFATAGKLHRNSINTATAAALIEIIHTFDEKAFDTDKTLLEQLNVWRPAGFDKPFRVVLVSPQTHCKLCGITVSLRRDRPACVVLYDYASGSIPGTHYHKECTSRICTPTQYYGFYTTGQVSQVFFNSDCKTLPYIVSSSLTVFSMKMLAQVDREVLISQQSYNQLAVYLITFTYSTWRIQGKYYAYYGYKHLRLVYILN